MKKTIVIALILLSSIGYSQNYKIVYNLDQVAKNIGLLTNIKTYLQGNGEISIYVEDFRNAQQQSTSGFDNISLPTEDNPTYFKELRKNIVIYNDDIRLKFFNIKDSITSFEWKIERETKEILGYTSQKATLNFRGRNFTVYFTTDIKISDGPLKFYGLPGLILEIISDDEIASFHYLAESIKLTDKKVDTENIFANKNLITYKEFFKIYNTKYDESLSRVINESGETRPMSKGFMEVFVND